MMWVHCRHILSAIGIINSIAVVVTILDTQNSEIIVDIQKFKKNLKHPEIP
jgi:hypothetical protein